MSKRHLFSRLFFEFQPRYRVVVVNKGNMTPLCMEFMNKRIYTYLKDDSTTFNGFCFPYDENHVFFLYLCHSSLPASSSDTLSFTLIYSIVLVLKDNSNKTGLHLIRTIALELATALQGNSYTVLPFFVVLVLLTGKKKV